jgi:hypothetical protein
MVDVDRRREQYCLVKRGSLHVSRERTHAESQHHHMVNGREMTRVISSRDVALRVVFDCVPAKLQVPQRL